uniref:Uncharacterized protein n=1 Tax=Macrostomum lignano TaxID=282301 RepID=A0A1I8F780_9PLAT
MLSEFDNRCATRVELLSEGSPSGVEAPAQNWSISQTSQETKKQQDPRQRNLQSCAAGAAAAAEPPAGSGGALTASRDAAYRYAPSEADLAVPNGSYHPAEQANFNAAARMTSMRPSLLAKLADFKAKKNDFLTQRIRSSMARSGPPIQCGSASDASAAVVLLLLGQPAPQLAFRAEPAAGMARAMSLRDSGVAMAT